MIHPQTLLPWSTHPPRRRFCALLLLGVPVLLLTPLAALVPVPLRILSGVLWLSLPCGLLLAERMMAQPSALPRFTHLAVAMLLGWCGASLLVLLAALLGLGWTVTGFMIALVQLASIWGLSPQDDRDCPAPPPETKRLSIFVGIVTVLALAYLARMGGFMSQDAYYHLAYVKELLDNGGPGSAHPFLDSTEFDPRYAISSFHSLLGFLTVFCGVSHLDVWFYLPCFWLLVGVGVWKMFGTVVLGSESRGDLCAAFFVLLALVGSPVSRSLGFHELRTLAYPGGCALHALIPALVVFAWEDRTRHRWRIAGIALIALTLASTHLFYCLLGLFILGCGFVGLTAFSREPRRMWAVGLSLSIAVVVSLPVFAWGWLHYSGVQNPVFEFDPSSSAPHDYRNHLLRFERGAFILHPKTWLTRTGLNAYRTNAPAVALLCLVFFWRKIQRDVLAFFLGIVLLFLFIVSFPPAFAAVTGTITIYKSFRLYQVLPVIPLLAIGADGLSGWALRLRSKVARQPRESISSPWLPAGICLALIWISVPDLFSRVRLLEQSWDSVHSWWREPRRDISRLRYEAIHRSASFHDRGTVLADPFDSMAYAAFHGGKVVAVPDYHASPTSTDIGERLDAVEAVRTGWYSTGEALECLSKYDVGLVLFPASTLSPTGEAVLSEVFGEEMRIAQSPGKPVKPKNLISHGETDYQAGYSLFVDRSLSQGPLDCVFIDLQVVDGEPIKLRRDGTLWSGSGEQVASVKRFLPGDTSERFARWQDGWVFATRSKRLIRQDGEEITLYDWVRAPGREEERPVAIIESQDKQDLLLFGSRGSLWATRPESGSQFDGAPVWGKELIRSACRDRQGGIFLLGAFGDIHVLGRTMPLPKERPNWGSGSGYLDRATDVALDSDGGCLYLLTRVGEVFRLHPEDGVSSRIVSQDTNKSVWVALVCDEDQIVVMDHRGRTSLIRFDL